MMPSSLKLEDTYSTMPKGFTTQRNTETPTIIDLSGTKKYPSATGSIIVGISVPPFQGRNGVFEL